MTLSDYLNAGYFHAMQGGPDPAPDCAANCSGGDLVNAMQAMVPILDRDHVSRVKTSFIQRVLALQG